MNRSSERTVAVVGGGITGLAAAYELGRAGHTRVVLVEADARLGGKLRTDEIDGIAVEAGADSFVATDGAALELCRELDLADELVAPARFGANIWRGGALRRLPADTVFGIPRSPRAAWRAGLLTARAAARAYADLVVPGRLRGPDVSVAALIRRRMGGEVLDRMVDPVLAGTRAGRADRMSLAAALPQIDAAARSHRSLLRTLRAGSHGPPPFLTPRSGMRRLVERASAETTADIVTEERVEELVARNGRCRLQLARGSVEADAVILCVPAYEAARMLVEVDERAAVMLGRIRYASAALVTLIYPPGSIAFPDGSGILVPSVEPAAIAGATFYSVKWPHTQPRDGRVVVRAFVGRQRHDPSLELDDDDLSARVADDLDRMLHPVAPPATTAVTRWPDSLPEYEVGHLDLLSSIDASLRRVGPIAVAGAGYRGSGIPDCIAQGRAAARAVAALLEEGRR